MRKPVYWGLIIAILLILNGCSGGKNSTPSVTVSTLAGLAGQSGLVNETGSNARFYLPIALTADTNGNLYVADKGNNAIRKVTPGGVATTFANGFSSPCGITIDAAGNLYLVNTFNNTIEKINSEGTVINTYLGTESGGSAFNRPYGAAVDGSGKIYVADTVGNIIRMISGSTVTTIAGSGAPGSANGNGSAASFNHPHGIVVDTSGNLFVSDMNNHTIRKIVIATGDVSTFAGSPGISGSSDDLGTEARFNSPASLAIDTANNIYVADALNQTIRKITPGGKVTTIAGYATHSGNADGTGTQARFWNPYGVAVDRWGKIYVADQFNHTIRKIVIH